MNISDFSMDEDRPPPVEVALVTMHSVLIVIGIVANTCLISVICSQRGLKNKNPLLIALLVCDLLVCAVSAPLAVYHAVFEVEFWPFPYIWCKAAFFVKSLPVTASTLTMMMLSIDRYINVRFPQPIGKYRIRRGLEIMSSVLCWIISFLVNTPVIITREVIKLVDGKLGCIEVWNSKEWKTCFTACNLIMIYILPCAVVMGCHMGLRDKLTALSLCTRAANGEIPLPMPLLRRASDLPIIVMGLTSKADGKVVTYHRPSGSLNDFSTEVRLVEIVETAITTPPRSKKLKLKLAVKVRRRGTLERLKKAKIELAIREELRKKKEENVRPLSSTVKSRSRMATALIATGAITTFCWLPYVICVICMMACADENSSDMKIVVEFALLLGHSHSVVNPIIYWAMNYQSLAHCACPCKCSCQCRCPRKNTFRNASSTNEDALGPFNPKYIKPTDKKSPVRRPSSCYLY